MMVPGSIVSRQQRIDPGQLVQLLLRVSRMVESFARFNMIAFALMVLLYQHNYAYGLRPMVSHDSDPALTINGVTSERQLGAIHGRSRLLGRNLVKSLSEQALMSIQSSDGDIIDCIPLENQPALDHPLLKDHKIQAFPSTYPTRIRKHARKRLRRSIPVPQIWHESGARCPSGSIPVRRTSEEDEARWATSMAERSSTASLATPPMYGTKTHKPARTHSKNNNTSAHQEEDDHAQQKPSNSSPKPIEVDIHSGPQLPTFSVATHEHAIAYIEGDEIYGASAVLSVWDPWIEASNEFSLSQLWILAGSFDGDLNSIEAGWQVSPELYGDGRPRLFIYWTADGYSTTGCYNLLCSGFIQISDTVAIGASIAPVSNYGGNQYQIEIMIWKDPRQGNWWMAFEGTHIVGYWPSALFSHLSDSANMVEWGGEVVNTNPYGHHTGTQMGSGRFAEDGFGYAGFFHSLQVVDSNNNLQTVTNVDTLAENPNCYDIQSMDDPNWGAAFYFGGPGRNALCP